MLGSATRVEGRYVLLVLGSAIALGANKTLALIAKQSIILFVEEGRMSSNGVNSATTAAGNFRWMSLVTVAEGSGIVPIAVRLGIGRGARESRFRHLLRRSRLCTPRSIRRAMIWLVLMPRTRWCRWTCP